MSADDFANTMKQINPAGTAFTERLQAAQREFQALQAMEKELKHDEHKFKQQLASLQQSLEGTTRSLASLHSKRAKLAKEMNQCDEEIARLEKHKVETTGKIQQVMAASSDQREEKLRQFGGPGAPTQPPVRTSAASTTPVADLLGDGPSAPSKATVSAPPPADLLGAEIAPSGGTGGGGSGGGGGAALDLLGLDAPPPPAAVLPQPTATQRIPSDAFDGFDGFDVSAPPAGPPKPTMPPPVSMGGSGGGLGADLFAQPPAGMALPYVGTPSSGVGGLHPMAMGGGGLGGGMGGGGMQGCGAMASVGGTCRQGMGAMGGSCGSGNSSQATQPPPQPTDPFAGLSGLGK